MLAPELPVELISADAFAAKLAAMRGAVKPGWPLLVEKEKEVGLTPTFKDQIQTLLGTEIPEKIVGAAPPVVSHVEHIDVDSMSNDSSQVPEENHADRVVSLKPMGNTVAVFSMFETSARDKQMRQHPVASAVVRGDKKKMKAAKIPRVKKVEAGVKRARVLDDYFTRR